MKTLIVLLILAFCATAAFAQDPGVPPPPNMQRLQNPGMSCPASLLSPPPPMLIERAEALNLSAEQKTKLEAIFNKNKDTFMPLRQKSMEAGQALHNAIFAATFDAAKVTQLAADAATAEAAIVKAELSMWTEIRGVINAEQAKQLQQIMGRGPGFGRPRPGGPGPGGPGPGNPGPGQGQEPPPPPPPAPGQ